LRVLFLDYWKYCFMREGNSSWRFETYCFLFRPLICKFDNFLIKLNFQRDLSTNPSPKTSRISGTTKRILPHFNNLHRHFNQKFIWRDKIKLNCLGISPKKKSYINSFLF
jgi:hypothetical protein